MPNVDGAALFEKLRNSEATRQIPVIFVASRKDIEERLQPLAGTVEDYIVKPFFVKDLVSRAKKVVDRIRLEKLQRAATRPGVIQGRLEEMSVLDLCQSLEMGQKSCRLLLRSAEKECSLFFQNGQVLDASIGTLRGDEAVYQVVLWNEGDFEIDFSMAPSQQTTTRSTQGLLMEALRLVDEANRGSAQG
jgi:DNA-binding response OmpR family regulator